MPGYFLLPAATAIAVWVENTMAEFFQTSQKTVVNQTLFRYNRDTLAIHGNWYHL
jgi:hypothetical protein